MFAFCGLAALISFIYIRPQEFIPLLARIPLLYLFFALAAFGLAVDIRLRVTRFKLPPQTLFVVLFFAWALTTIAIYAPADLMSSVIELMVIAVVFTLISIGVQSLRSFRWLIWLLAALSFALAVVGVHQGNADLGCVEVDRESAEDLRTGTYDGRGCTEPSECYGGDANPSAGYLCEQIGLFGTTSIAGRVRYRGILQDPNELALAISVAWGLSFGLLGVGRRRRLTKLFVAVSGLVTGVCVVYTQSRGGMLVLLTVIGVYMLWRFGRKGALVGGVLALALVVVSSAGSGRKDADKSSEERVEAWSTAVDLFKSNPVTGVGGDQFTKHHYLTAHNSYLLVAAELGLPGMFFWLAILYLSLKSSFLISMRYRGDPDAAEAVRLSDALFGALCGLAVGSFFLSLSYHAVMWIMFGLSGALYGAVRAHDPKFRIRFGILDAAVVFGGGIALIVFVRIFLRLKGV